MPVPVCHCASCLGAQRVVHSLKLCCCQVLDGPTKKGPRMFYGDVGAKFAGWDIRLLRWVSPSKGAPDVQHTMPCSLGAGVCLPQGCSLFKRTCTAVHAAKSSALSCMAFDNQHLACRGVDKTGQPLLHIAKAAHFYDKNTGAVTEAGCLCLSWKTHAHAPVFVQSCTSRCVVG